MTDREAIAIFTGLKMMVGTEAKEACDIAISALQEREERSNGCEFCGGGKTLYQQTRNTKLYINTFGKARTLVTESIQCPPFAKCCLKGVSANSVFLINFCPECGRNLKGADNG